MRISTEAAVFIISLLLEPSATNATTLATSFEFAQSNSVKGAIKSIHSKQVANMNSPDD
jgi:hypothetical protein